MLFRDATDADLPTIVAIYNATIPGRGVTADLEPVSVPSRRAWFDAHDTRRRPLWVAEDDGVVIGWLSFSDFYGRPAYAASVEVSIYLAEAARGQGLGRTFLQRAIDRAPDYGVRTLLGFIFGHNVASLALFQRFGFTRWGVLPRVASLDDVERDLIIVGLRLETAVLIMYVDSHCHLDFPEFAARMPDVLGRMAEHRVTHAMAISVDLAAFPNVLAVAESAPHLYASVGVHPDHEDTKEPTIDELVELAAHPKVVAIGETGLDYYRLTGDLEWQRERFRVHIRAARVTGKPLVIHTRASAKDTLAVMREEGAGEVGGVMHCFTETWEVAEAALDLGFHISMSGIVTFKNAKIVQDVAQRVPLDRLLIETDSPYLAPVPFRGKTNEPAFVAHVAAKVAELRGTTAEAIGEATTENFFRLFGGARAT